MGVKVGSQFRWGPRPKALGVFECLWRRLNSNSMTYFFWKKLRRSRTWLEHVVLYSALICFDNVFVQCMCWAVWKDVDTCGLWQPDRPTVMIGNLPAEPRLRKLSFRPRWRWCQEISTGTFLIPLANALMRQRDSLHGHAGDWVQGLPRREQMWCHCTVTAPCPPIQRLAKVQRVTSLGESLAKVWRTPSERQVRCTHSGSVVSEERVYYIEGIVTRNHSTGHFVRENKLLTDSFRYGHSFASYSDIYIYNPIADRVWPKFFVDLAKVNIFLPPNR